MKTIDDFVDRLIAEKNFDTKDPDVVAQLKADLLTRIDDRIKAMIVENMPEDAFTEFNTILGTNDEAKISTYVRQHIPDIDEKTAGVLLNFKTIYLS